MKKLIISLLLILPVIVIAQPKTDCLCNGSSANKGKFYVGLGSDFHIGFFENDDNKFNHSALGFLFHGGYNLNKNFSFQLNFQKYSMQNSIWNEKYTTTARFSYLDLSLYGVYRFIDRGSRVIPYLQGGYVMNNVLKKEKENPGGYSEQNGFQLHAHYINLGGGALFILANKFTIFTEGGLNFHSESIFRGTYSSEIYKYKLNLSAGINYHF